jgi:hypothetical protein
MSERFPDCVTTTDHIPATRAAIGAVEDEEMGIRALIACLQRSGMERVFLGVQPLSKGGKRMRERSMDCSTATDHTPAKGVTILLVEDKERVLRALLAFLQRRGFEVIGVGTVEEAEQCIMEGGSENIQARINQQRRNRNDY